MISKAQLNDDLLCVFVPLTSDCLKRLYEKSGRLRSVGRYIVPDSRSSCTESSVAEDGPRPTDEKCTSLSRAQSSRYS